MKDDDKTDNKSDYAENGNNHRPIALRIIGASVLGVIVLAVVARFLPDMKERIRFFRHLSRLIGFSHRCSASLFLHEAVGRNAGRLERNEDFPRN